MATVAAPPKRYRIVRATPEHLGALVRLYELLMAERGQPVDDKGLANVADSVFASLAREDERLWVAVIGKKVVGFLWAEILLSPTRHAVNGTYFYVRPEARRIGRLSWDLYQAVIVWARALKAPITAQVPPAEVQRWQRRGYRPVSVLVIKEPEA